MLPFPILVFLGTGMGLLVFSLPSSRKRIAQKNIEVCFPNLSSDEQYALLRKNFISMGIAIMEVGMAWWWSKRRLKKLITYDGLEHLTSVPSGQGTMLLGIHFTTLEIGGAAVAMATQMDGMYRAHGNPVYDYVQACGRISKGSGDTMVFERRDVRGSMRALKTDEHYGTAPTKTMALYKGYLHRFLVFRRQLYMQRLDLLRKLEQQWSLLPTFGFQAPEAIK